MKIQNCLYPGYTYNYVSDESGSDSDGAESTSSSYSSLSDFVTDMVNSEIDGDTPCKYIGGFVIWKCYLLLFEWLLKGGKI